MAINPNAYSYSRNAQGILVRSDGVFVPEDNPNNGTYLLYRQWVAAGNAHIPGHHQPNFPHTPPGDGDGPVPEDKTR